MNWKYVKKLKGIDLINEYEHLVNYTFDDFFKKCVIDNNGGRPSDSAFDTDKVNEREIKSLLSFNHEDAETVWNIFEWSKEDLKGRYIPFGIDNFGNLICFDASNGNVIFLNHENNNAEFIADDFQKFLSKLY